MRGELIADLPEDERPRERLAMHGAKTLSDTELLAILIGSGVRGRSALQVARELLGDGLNALTRRDWSSGNRLHGIGPAKSTRIAAALELGRRVAARDTAPGDPIRDPELIARSLIARYSHHVQERLGGLFLDSKHRLISEREIYIGTLNATTVSTRDVLRIALAEHAASVIVFHNHPSGDPAPSSEDLLFTRKLVEAGKLMGVDVVDHLILGTNRFVSLRQRGAMG
ncbi:MAG TPA: DNA repair protein RadC [Thermoanaerobaculia bacterium]|nr:DNA repair protein RadC [Thermoanaerobaculia bacterium]